MAERVCLLGEFELTHRDDRGFGVELVEARVDARDHRRVDRLAPRVEGVGLEERPRLEQRLPRHVGEATLPRVAQCEVQVAHLVAPQPVEDRHRRRHVLAVGGEAGEAVRVVDRRRVAAVRGGAVEPREVEQPRALRILVEDAAEAHKVAALAPHLLGDVVRDRVVEHPHVVVLDDRHREADEDRRDGEQRDAAEAADGLAQLALRLARLEPRRDRHHRRRPHRLGRRRQRADVAGARRVEHDGEEIAARQLSEERRHLCAARL